MNGCKYTDAGARQVAALLRWYTVGMKSGVLALMILAAPFVAGAQTSGSCDASLPVTIALTSEIVSTVPSASIGIYAGMQNTGANAISDAALAVEVVQKDTGAVIDRFVVPQRIAVFANSSAKAGFVWKVPSGTASGTYTVIATFAPKGAPRAEAFAHVYPSASLDVHVDAGAATPASVRALTVNGSAYSPDTVARFVETGSVSVGAAVRNQAQGPYKGAITWRLYAPDATLFDEPLDSRETSVELHPEQSANMQYDLPTLTLGSYYLEGELSDGGSTSYFDILLAREDGAFAWTKCIAPAADSKSSSGNTILIVSVTALIIAVGVMWEFAKRRHV